MTAIAITGADGFLGWHLRCRLRALSPNTTVLPIDRNSFSDSRLEAALQLADVVIHLAAINSHDPDLAAQNHAITERLLSALATTSTVSSVIFANSTHSLTDSPYGAAKRRVAEELRIWANKHGATFSDLLFPNLFGEGGRPFTNSVVATMCDSFVHGSPFTMNPDGQTELLHAQDASDLLIEAASQREDCSRRVNGHSISVPELFEILDSMFQTYSGTNVIPPFADEFGLHLFNQLRFAMYPDFAPVSLRSGVDDRGSYTELARSFEGSQVSVSTTRPGAVRGQHFHFNKVERFAVVAGTATIQIRRLFDDRVRSFELNGDSPSFIDIPTLHTHNLINSGEDELITVFWSNDHFDPANPDTFSELVNLETTP